MQIQINGAAHEIADDTTMNQLVEMLDLQGKRFAIEVNEELVPRSTFSEYRLSPGDRVEVVQAIGGG
jgi:sulfur carrier protein